VLEEQGVDALRELDGDAVGGAGDFDIPGTGNAFGQGAASERRSNAILGGTHDERGNAPELAEEGRGVPAPHGPNWCITTGG